MSKHYYLDYLQNGGSKKSKSKKMKNSTSVKRFINLDDYNNMTNSTESITKKYIENLSEPWFSFVSMGLKTVEGRKNKGRFAEMNVGDLIEWTNSDFMPRNVLTKIVGKATYPTFEEYLQMEGLNRCLPGIPSMEHGLSVYYKYFTKEDEAEYGVIALRLELIHT